MEAPITDIHPALKAAENAGFDLSLLESNLALSPAERWLQHSLALDMALELQQARLIRDPRLQPASPPSR